MYPRPLDLPLWELRGYFVMLVSPKAWFALPTWLKLHGVLTLKQYGTGWGAWQVRILGAIAILTICYVGFSILTHK